MEGKKDICQFCNKIIGGYSKELRKFHGDCYKEFVRQKKIRISQNIKKYRSMNTNEKRTLVYIGRYISNPEKLTKQQLTDICSSYNADYSTVKSNLNLTEEASKLENQKGLTISTD